MRIMHKESSMPEERVMACSRFRKVLLKAGEIKGMPINWLLVSETKAGTRRS